MKQGKTDSASSIEQSPKRARKNRKKREREERAWAAKSGPVSIYFEKK